MQKITTSRVKLIQVFYSFIIVEYYTLYLGRDLSPNSTPGLQNQQQPPPSATPPNQLISGGLDILNDSQRQPQWHHPISANQNFLLGKLLTFF